MQPAPKAPALPELSHRGVLGCQAPMQSCQLSASRVSDAILSERAAVTAARSLAGEATGSGVRWVGALAEQKTEPSPRQGPKGAGA